jgi:hypothetical protein
MLAAIVSIFINVSLKKYPKYIDAFQGSAPVPVAKPIPGFIIPTPVVPKKPPPQTNSNGGLVSIS